MIIYPFLFSLYPILGLYSRNLTEILPSEVIRPSLSDCFDHDIYLLFFA